MTVETRPRPIAAGPLVPDSIVEVRGVAKIYGGGVEALRGIDLDFPRGRLTTLLGPSGCGKTTLLKIIGGLVEPSAGEIRFCGRDVAGAPPERIARLGAGLVPEGRQIFPTLTVRENLVATAANRLRRDDPWTLERVYALFPRLKERRPQLAGTLSGGEQQMLAMGRALMSQPRLLMLDEPSLGLAPKIVADIFRTITELRQAGVSILLVEQNANAALRIADRAYVMELGEFILSGSAHEIAADQRVVASYLGFEHREPSRVYTQLDGLSLLDGFRFDLNRDRRE